MSTDKTLSSRMREALHFQIWQAKVDVSESQKRSLSRMGRRFLKLSSLPRQDKPSPQDSDSTHLCKQPLLKSSELENGPPRMSSTTRPLYETEAASLDKAGGMAKSPSPVTQHSEKKQLPGLTQEKSPGACVGKSDLKRNKPGTRAPETSFADTGNTRDATTRAPTTSNDINWKLIPSAEGPPEKSLGGLEEPPRMPKDVKNVSSKFLNIPLRGRGLEAQRDFIIKRTNLSPHAGLSFGLNPGDLYKKQFKWYQQLGRGTFGTVFLVKDRYTAFPCAAKICWKYKMQHTTWLEREVRIHCQLDHPNIISFYGYWQSDHDVTLILEYAHLGTLSDMIQDTKKIKESQAAKCVLQIASALEYLHSKNIIHRDVKTDNILVAENGDIKLCDFGWAIQTEPNGRRSSHHGTMDYRAPESCEKNECGIVQYDERVDIWALGCVMFELLVGHCPFDDDLEATPRRIANVHYTIPPKVKILARMLIEQILVKDPARRLTLEGIMAHPWILKHTQLHSTSKHK